jgi:hypothetical protein
MSFNNLENRHFSTAEKTTVDTALASLELALTAKLANLSAAERQQYGSVNEQNKLIINKVKSFNDTQPTLSSPDIDWVEFNSDYDSREYLQSLVLRLQSLIDGLGNAKILHDYDNYQAALTDYDFTKYKASTNAAGFQTKVAELSQFFSGRPSGSTDKASTETPNTP